jgi:hypothetical protein
VLNKTFDNHDIKMTVLSPSGASLKMMRADKLDLAPDELNEGEFMIKMPQKMIASNRIPVQIQVWMDNKPLYTKKAVFIAPVH